MSVKIRIKGNDSTSEYQDALVLKDLFEKGLTNNHTDGEILIFSNAILFGQDVKDVDLIVLGYFSDYSCNVKSKAVNPQVKSKAVNPQKEELPLEMRKVYINNFCFVIETKRHRAEDVQMNGPTMLVRYNTKWSDVTTQSEKQKYSLKNFFLDRLGEAPYICNFIWFRNISWQSLSELLGDNEIVRVKHNFLPDTFSLPFLFQLACVQRIPRIPYNAVETESGKPKKSSSFNCWTRQHKINYDDMQSSLFDDMQSSLFDDMQSSLFEIFERVKSGVGYLSRKRLELMTKKILDDQQYAHAIGNKLVVISGKAGTGKTIKLLRIAVDLTLNRNARCLILTYNTALVSDIKRIIAIAGIVEEIDLRTMKIETLHKFIYQLLLGLGIGVSKNSDNRVDRFLEKYDEYLDSMYQYLESGLIQDTDIQDLMKNRHDEVNWDYVLIDESQDWKEAEKKLIMKVFGKEKLVITDGYDQLVRSSLKCSWTSGLKHGSQFIKTNERRGLRQKVNLVSFVNSYAREIGIHWEIEPKQELIGGKIIISTVGYFKDLHDREKKKCLDDGNKEYEMMFLVPPKMVDVKRKTNRWNEIEEERCFKYLNTFKELGIQIWDGTSRNLRSEYPSEPNVHRLIQYESCRGLEGWTVVCLEIDEFVKYKTDTFVAEDDGELAVESFEEKRDRFVKLWSLIPLTRAIDTIIITLHDKESVVGKAFRRVYEINRDFVEWIDSVPAALNDQVNHTLGNL